MLVRMAATMACSWHFDFLPRREALAEVMSTQYYSGADTLVTGDDDEIMDIPATQMWAEPEQPQVSMSVEDVACRGGGLADVMDESIFSWADALPETQMYSDSMPQAEWSREQRRCPEAAAMPPPPRPKAFSATPETKRPRNVGAETPESIPMTQMYDDSITGVADPRSSPRWQAFGETQPYEDNEADFGYHRGQAQALLKDDGGRVEHRDLAPGHPDGMLCEGRPDAPSSAFMPPPPRPKAFGATPEAKRHGNVSAATPEGIPMTQMYDDSLTEVAERADSRSALGMSEGQNTGVS